MSLKEQLNEDMKAALRAGDKARLSILRLALAAIKQREVDTRKPVDDAATQAIIEKMIKQARDSIGQYRSNQREDLASKEEAELAVLESYLPEPLGAEEIEELIAEAIDSTGATGPRDMGGVMAFLKERAAGRFDAREISAQVRAALSDD